ncbi:MAG TPA: C1 family peptidase [Polyangiaceae bacterium]|nr:C1 family peptidase [Polyangiaceae bacterium]
MLRRASVLSVLFILACKSDRELPPGAFDAGAARVAPGDSSRAKAPPPLKGSNLKAPPLPDLPELQQHEAAAALPLTVRLANAAATCKSAWDGSEVVPRSCFKSALLFGSNRDGAKPLISHKLLRGGAKVPLPLPAVVDHRADGTEGPVRNQSSVPACTAFAEAAALDHAVARWMPKAAHVSVMQIWSRYHTAVEQNAIQANLGQPLGAEEDWPYGVGEATSWLPCDEVQNPKKYGCGQPINATHLKKAEGHAVAHFTRVVFLQKPDTDGLREILASGQDVIVTMIIPDSFVPKGKPGARYIPHYASVQNEDVGHAMVLAGYATLPHGTYFLLHNSWGTGWGDGGYAWIHEADVAQWTREYLVLDAEPELTGGKNQAARARGTTTCGPGLLIDSIDGECAPSCPDGSPRHDDVCGTTAGCPDGYVNLTGACVRAAPTSTGTDPKSGIGWTCGSGGCTYAVPKALDPTCTGNTCQLSCPAPNYRVASEGSSLVCVR